MDAKQVDQVLDNFEKIELTKNTKGYGWTIVVKGEKIDEAFIKRLKDINDKMHTDFGKDFGAASY